MGGAPVSGEWQLLAELSWSAILRHSAGSRVVPGSKRAHNGLFWMAATRRYGGMPCSDGAGEA